MAERSKGRGTGDPRVSALLDALRRDPEFTQDTLVVKLPKDRVADLVARKVGAAFDPGHGRVMKEWLAIASPKASWVDLAKEAHAFVAGGSTPAPKRATRPKR